MNTENPFEVSKLYSGVALADLPFTSPDMFRVEGDVLVCGHPVVLPRICARGLTSDNLVGKNTLVHLSAFGPALVCRSCSVTYFVRQSSTHRRLVTFAVGVGFIAGVFFLVEILHLMMTHSASQDLLRASVYIVGIGLLIIVGAFLWWKQDSIRLTLVSYAAPGIYRIRGFSQNYLDAISSQVTDLRKNISSADLTNQNQ